MVLNSFQVLECASILQWYLSSRPDAPPSGPLLSRRIAPEALDGEPTKR